ncbi:MAG: sensor histidine kinase, partial [Marinirhabdus sp.]
MYVHKPLKEYDSAYYKLYDAMIYELEKDFTDNEERISKLEVELNTAETENQLLISEEKQKRNRYIALGLGALLLLVATIAYLITKNTQRKHRIAEQQREIEIQKTEKILKEQELTTIDAMLAGQEKERQRLASDLHDSVGATLAAARMQFEHISKHKQGLPNYDEIIAHTGKLLETAYTEVRDLAHAKNSGVIAKNGLLPAVQKLARNASATKKLDITVEGFGLEKRLENTIEITIFRIVQELVTNIIKHAGATRASIA